MPKPTVPTSGSSKQNPDEQMSENEAVTEIYRHEINRLKSFSGWISSASAAPTLLAKAGFFYTNQDDTVECFICRVRINQWKMSDDPMKEHKLNSPGCIFVHGGNSGNVPMNAGQKTQTPEVQRKVPEPINVETNEAAFTKEIEEKLEVLSQKYPSMQEKLEHLKTSTGKPQSPKKAAPMKTPYDERPILNLNVGQTGSLSRNLSGPGSYEFVENPPAHIPGESIVEPQHSYGTTLFSNPTLGDAFPYGDPTRALTIAQIEVELTSGRPCSGATERCTMSDLVPLVQSSNCPEFSLIRKRLESFTGWTYAQNANPRKLAEAGFFYAGDSDRVRCFHCNGGLCNWQAEDIPWYEHYRWFGKCPYLLKAMKNEVVKVTISTAKHIHGARAVEQKKHHHHGSGRTQCDPVRDIWKTDNMKRLLSMGFTRTNIQSAMDKKGSQIVNDIDKMIDILDKPASATVSRPPPVLTSPTPVVTSPKQSKIKHQGYCHVIEQSSQ